jgi:ATP-dependent DNA helicase RecG
VTESTRLPLPKAPTPTDGTLRGVIPTLETFLSALLPPLTYLATARPEAAQRARWASGRAAAQARALAATVAEAALRRDLERLAAALDAIAVAPPEERGRHAVRAATLADRLRPDVAGEPPLYQQHPGHTVSHLEALAQPVQFVAGVGPRRAEQLRRFGIATVEDLLYHLPFRYEDRRTLSTVRALRVGEVASVVGELTHLAERHVGRSQRRILEGVLRDDTGLLALTWFHQVTYFHRRFEVGQRCLVHGKVESGPTGQKRMVHPEIETGSDLEAQGILPVYAKPTTMSVGVIRQIARRAVAEWAPRLPSVLPTPVARRARVMDLAHAMQQLHAPDRDADVEALNSARSAAHRSVVFDELFFLQLGMALRRRAVERESGLALPEHGHLTGPLTTLLPFALTGAQHRALRDIRADMAQPHPMHRLLQGDVGSGKTIVALFAALVAVENGYQAAFMAPTELLAEQHFATVSRFTRLLGVSTELLTGSLPRAQRRVRYEGLASGATQIAVGTHALIQEPVAFHRIGLGIIDEQHRFGVMQRAALRRLGAMPDMLLMTATPIPRTLAMTVYGDLDISVLDELPPGRQPVRTLLRHEGERATVYDVVKRELDRGRQGYVVYPLVETSDAVALRDATSMAHELARQVFHSYRVGLLHGRMKAAEKEAVMRRFKAGDIQLLVSTTVIEVGIDVPNATVMVVEHADRFGLAQLHQLRGRVGRGGDAATCALLTAFRRSDDAYRRLEALAHSNDGFEIAEADLELRGPGELLGTRQSGLPDFRVANLIRDQRILEDARRAALEWLAADPELSRPESALLRPVLAHRWAGRLELAQVG